MFISQEEALARLQSPDNLLNRLGVPVSPNSEPESRPPTQPVERALEEAAENPTIPSEDDAVRLAVLAGRRHLRGDGRGRYPQQGNVPPVFRAMIGAAARMGTTVAAAKAFGVSPMQAHHYKHGKTGQNAEPDANLLSMIEKNTLGIRDQVLSVLSFTVAGITKESLENKDAKELSIIARNLSSIMSSTKPPADFGDKSTNAQVIVFSPEQEKEASYNTIEVG